MFGPMQNTTMTQVTFIKVTVSAMLTSDRGSFTMNYTFTLEGNVLVLEPQFGGSGGFPPGGQPFNGSRPPNNSTQPWNGTQPPTDRDRPSMSIRLEYSFNEQNTILYLDGSPFIKNY